jgi:hypothetical protein
VSGWDDWRIAEDEVTLNAVISSTERETVYRYLSTSRLQLLGSLQIKKVHRWFYNRNSSEHTGMTFLTRSFALGTQQCY